MDEKENCPICGEGHVTNHVDQVETEYKGHKELVPLHYQLCDACDSDFAGEAEMRANNDALRTFRQSVDALSVGHHESFAIRE